MEKLILKQKMVKDGIDYFVFINSASTSKQLTLNYNDSLKLISQYESKDRNCKVSAGAIGLKAGLGRLPVQKVTSEQPESFVGVNILTLPKYLDKCDIKFNDNYFVDVSDDQEFLENNQDIIFKVDKARIEQTGRYEIVTPFGPAMFSDLSTGLKTILNIRYILTHTARSKPIIVSGNECGDNVLPLVFQEVNNTNIYLFISYPCNAIDISSMTFYIKRV